MANQSSVQPPEEPVTPAPVSPPVQTSAPERAQPAEQANKPEGPEQAAEQAPEQLSPEELRLMADTMPGDGPGGD